MRLRIWSLPISGFSPSLNNVVKEVTDNMENFELGVAVQKVYDFIWDEFCDWYIEMVKPRLYATDDADSTERCTVDVKDCPDRRFKTSASVYAFYYRRNLLHPAVRRGIHHDFLLAGLSGKRDTSRKKSRRLKSIKEAVRGVRNVRTSMNVPPSRKAHVYVVSDQKELQNTFEEGKLFFASLGERIRCDLSGGQDRYRRGRGIRCDPERNPLYSICRAG